MIQQIGNKEMGHQRPWSDEDRDAAIERAFDYRGDVTLRLTGERALTGYVCNRQGRGSAAWVEVLLADSSAPRRIQACEILAIEFTGKDAALGKSWEAWLQKVADAKARGEIAELYPDE